jgi:predicted MPP superfamily phosphohydrolase
MGPALDLPLIAAALIGHFSIAVWLFNRLHAFAIPRRAIKGLEKLLVLAAVSMLALLVVRYIVLGRDLISPLSPSQPIGQCALSGYIGICWLAAALAIPCWLIPKLRERTPDALLLNHTTHVDVAARLGFRPLHGAGTRLLGHFPGNELLRIAVQQKTLRLPSLPRELDGLTIAHLSDLHMTGQLGREFYDCVVDETNALDADLVVITGDILEKERCLPWIGPTLGRLKARRGKYFILGNHEKRLSDVAPLRQALGDAGLVDLGGRCEHCVIRGCGILLSGTELPWFGAAPDLNSEFRIQNSELDSFDTRTLNPEPSFRILLSHTPDQLSWAKSHGFDLMLAGHNHGGQIRLPYLGALIAPSRYGFRYAGGLYLEQPTLLHVSRGLAGIHPIRLNCLPEIALLILKSA